MTKDKALFLYGFDINSFNQYLNFRNVVAGPELTAVLNPGNYTLTGLFEEIKRAIGVVDITNTYTLTVDRTISAGTSNLVHFSTSGSYLDLLFGTGTNAPNSIRSLIGFASLDYTGSTSYVGGSQAGIILIPDFATYGYIGPDYFAVNDGVKNVSSSGVKETLVFAQMFFIEGQWKYITNEFGNSQATQWTTFLKYAIKQRKFEFTPSIEEDPSTFYQVTMEKTPADGSNGMGYTLPQMLGEGLYRYYDTGKLTMRLIPVD